MDNLILFISNYNKYHWIFYFSLPFLAILQQTEEKGDSVKGQLGDWDELFDEKSVMQL